MKKYLPVILYSLARLGVILISFLVELRFPMPKALAKFLGPFMVYAGSALVIWAAVHMKGALGAEVAPRLSVLVKDGPYRFVRHPVYLRSSIALFGVTVALRSWLGLVALFLLFLPSALHRARLEEKALAEKFGTEWKSYARQTGFFLPSLSRRAKPSPGKPTRP